MRNLFVEKYFLWDFLAGVTMFYELITNHYVKIFKHSNAQFAYHQTL